MKVKLLASFRNTVYFDIENDMVNSVYEFSDSFYINDRDASLNKKEETTEDIEFKYYGLKKGESYRITINSEVEQGFYEVRLGSAFSSISTSGIRTFVFNATDDYIRLILKDSFIGSIKEFSYEEVNYTNIDLEEELEILLNYESFSSKNLGTKTYLYSKEIKIPKTSNNNKFFRNYFDSNQDFFYNYKKNINSSIQFEDNTYIEGFLIIKEFDDDYYVAIFYEEIINLITKLGDKLLSDLLLTAYTHTNNNNTIEGSWTSFPDTPYVYPFVDYGKSYYGINGYCLQSVTDNTWTGLLGHDLFPAISVKYLIDEIFIEAGYTYTSEFFESEQFKKLILPYTNDISKLDGKPALVFGCSANDSNPYVYAYPSTTQAGSSTFITTFYNHWVNGFNSIPGPYESSSTGILQAGYSLANVRFNNKGTDYYNLNPAIEQFWGYQTTNNVLNVSDDSQSNNVGFRTLQAGSKATSNENLINGVQVEKNQNHFPNWIYKVKKPSKYRTTGSVTVRGLGQGAFYNTNSLRFFWVKVGGGFHQMVLEEYDTDAGNEIYYLSQYMFQQKPELVDAAYIYDDSENIVLDEVEFDCNAGDIIYLAALHNNSSDGSTSFMSYEITGQWGLYDLEYSPNQEIKGEDVVPEDMKQIDFLKSLITMFNLYLTYDKNNKNNILIEPRDKYYENGSGTTFNYTDKIDIDSIEYTIPSTEYKNQYIFNHFKTDSDFYNYYYNDRNEYTYGSKVCLIDNDLSKGEEKITDIFSPTWIKEININNDWRINNISPLITTRLLKRDTSQFENGTLRETVNRDIKRNPTILYYNWRELSGSTSLNFRWRFDDDNYTSYPYAGHVIYPLGTSESSETNYNLQWNTESYGVFTTQYSNNNLYNLYYKKQFETIKNKNALKLTAYFYLDSEDIYNLDFNNKILIDGTYYYVQKIKDFNPNKLTEMELLKVIDEYIIDYDEIETIDNVPTTPGSVPVNLNPNGFVNVDDVDGYEPTPYDGIFNISGEENTVFFGSNNAGETTTINGSQNILSSGGIVIGNENKLTSGGTIVGNNNTTTQNVNIIGGSNVNVSNSTTGKTEYYVTVIAGNNTEIDVNKYDSNTVIINNDTIINKGSIKTEGGTKDGGYNMVQNPFGIDIIDFCDGGFNNNRLPSSLRARNYTDGGKNNV